MSCAGFEVSQEGEVLSVKLPSLRPSPSDAAGVSLVLDVGSVPVERACELVGALGPNLTATPFPDLKAVVISGPYAEVVAFGKQEEVSKAVTAIRAADLPPRVIGIQVEVIEVLEDDLWRLGVGWKGPLGEPGLSIGLKETDPTSFLRGKPRRL